MNTELLKRIENAAYKIAFKRNLPYWLIMLRAIDRAEYILREFGLASVLCWLSQIERETNLG